MMDSPPTHARPSGGGGKGDERRGRMGDVGRGRGPYRRSPTRFMNHLCNPRKWTALRWLRPPAALPMLLGVACATLCLAPAGCGYHVSGSPENATGGYQWSTLYRGDVNTVAVPIFQNKTY